MKHHDNLLGALVHDVAHLLRLEIDRCVRERNLTRVKWIALQEIEKRPHLNQNELAARLGLGPASVGQLVDRLESRGFIQREPDPEDRRAFRLVVTRKAVNALDSLEETALRLQSELMEGLSSQEVLSLSRSLKKLKHNLHRRAPTLPIALATWEVDEISELAAFAQLTGLL